MSKYFNIFLNFEAFFLLNEYVLITLVHYSKTETSAFHRGCMVMWWLALSAHSRKPQQGTLCAF